VLPDKTLDFVNKPTGDEDVWSLQMDQLIAPMLKEIKLLRTRVEELEKN
jgi:hypothetical protein